MPLPSYPEMNKITMLYPNPQVLLGEEMEKHLCSRPVKKLFEYYQSYIEDFNTKVNSKEGEMTTVLSDEQIIENQHLKPFADSEDDVLSLRFNDLRELAKAQDTHTRSELARQVREIQNPGEQERAFNIAIQAVLKLIEDKE